MFDLSAYPTLTLPAVVLLLVLILRRPIAWLLTPRGIPGVPSVPGTKPILGDIPYMARARMRDGENSKFMEELTDELGPLYVMRLGFLYRNVVLSDYDEVERLLLSPGRSLDKPKWTCRMFSPILDKAIVGLPTNDMFKHHYRLMGPTMTPKYLSLSMGLPVETALELVELFKEKIVKSQGRAWDASKDMESAVMDALWGITFGEAGTTTASFLEQVRASSIKVPVDSTGAAVFSCRRPDLTDSTVHFYEDVSTNPLFNKQLHWYVSRTPSYRRHKARVEQYLHSRIAEARKVAAAKGAEAALETAESALDMMVARELKGHDWLPEAEMKQELLEYLVGGTETTSTTLVWWMKLMTNHPEIQHRLHEHLLAACPQILDQPLKYEDLTPDRTPYLEAVATETLRFGNSTGGFMRETTTDTMILGHLIPKGTGVIVPTHACTRESAPRELKAEGGDEFHRKVGHWAPGTAKLFQPERWLDKDGKFDSHAGPSIHFGMGHRACFGRNLAIMQVRLFIAYLSTNFFFAPLPEHQNGMTATQTIARHADQPYIRPVPWTSPEAKKQ